MESVISVTSKNRVWDTYLLIAATKILYQIIGCDRNSSKFDDTLA